MSFAAAIAQSIGGLNSGLQQLVGGISNNVIASNLSEMIEMNALNLMTATQAQEDVSNFRASTADATAEASNTVAPTAGIGSSVQNSLLVNNISSAVNETAAGLQERATNQAQHVQQINAENQSSFNSWQSDVKSTIDIGFSAGGIIGGLIATAVGLSKGAEAPKEAQAPQTATATNVDMPNVNTGYSQVGMVNPSTTGHERAIEEAVSRANNSIDETVAEINNTTAESEV